MSRRPSLPDPMDVVSGRARASIEQLFSLIHEVNPTDLPLQPRVRADRYALKARLQSLLIRQHSDNLTVDRDPADDRVVSIRHRIAGRDACHAVVPSLDDDARRWVETELTLQRAPAPTAAVPRVERRSREGAPRDPLAAGQQALERYEFEEARASFEAALECSRGGVEAARALLELLVDHLVDDASAVALEGRLSKQSLADGEVLGLLALAAARLDEWERARRWLRGADATRASEALVLLVEGALRQGAADEARGHLTGLQDLAPSHPALGRLREALGRVRAQERQPAEAALTAAATRGDWEAVEVMAREILARWPDSEPARAALRTIEQRQRAEQARSLVARAWEAWDRGDTTAVLLAVKQARTLSPGDAELAEWLDEAEAVAREQIEIAELGRVRGLLRGGDLAGGLRGWLALPAHLREEIRRAHLLVEFRWLDELLEEDGRVEAALALGAARRAMDANDPASAASLVEPHARLLRSVPDARPVLAAVASHRAAESDKAASAVIAEVEEARATGDFDRALRLVANVPAGQRRALRERIETDRERAARVRRRDDAVASGDLLTARRLARELGDTTSLDEVSARLRQEWHIEVADGADIGVADVVWTGDPPCPNPWLVDDGNAMVFTEVLGGWVFARVIDLATLTVRRVVSLRAPGPMRVHYCLVDGDTVSVVDTYGSLLQFRLSDGDVVRWLARPPGVPGEDQLVEGTTLAPGGRFLWMTIHGFLGAELRVYDTERWPTYRLAESAGYGVPLLGNAEPAVARLDARKGAKLHSPNGNLLSRRTFVAEMRMTRVAVHPDGFPMCGIVDATERRRHGEEEVEPELRDKLSPEPAGFFWPYADRENGKVEIFRLSRISHPHQLATARADGSVYVKAGPGGVSQIITFSKGADGNLRDDGNSFWVPTTTMFVTDAQSRRVRALSRTEGGIQVIPLDGTAPDREMHEVHNENYRTLWPDDGLDFHLGCRYDASVPTATSEALARVLKPMGAARRAEWIAAFKETQSADPSALFDLGSALAHLEVRQEAEDLFNATGEQFPDHPRWRLLRACVDARGGDWASVLERLDGVEASALEPVHAQHFLHLRGIARLRAGDRAGGDADVRRAVGLEGRCSIHAPVALLDVLDGVEIPDSVSDTESYLRSRYGPVIHGILAADRCLDGNDGEGAVAALDNVMVWRARERQSLARLAEGWLLLNPVEPVRRLRRRIALARFLGVHEGYSFGFGHDLPIPPHSWGKERLEELAKRVGAELEGDVRLSPT